MMSSCGFSMIDWMSSLAPDTTKNSGMKTPKATPMSFVSSTVPSPSEAKSLRMTPATNAPMATSSPKTSAVATRPRRSSTVRRMAVCELVPCPRSITVRTRSDFSQPGTFAKARATTENRATATRPMAGLAVVRRMEMARMGPNSPMAPAPMK